MGWPLWLLWLACIAEISVAWLNIQYRFPKTVWLGNVLLFGILTVVSASNLGAKHCGCLGPLEVPSSWLFVFDIVVLVGLILISLQSPGRWRAPFLWAKIGMDQLLNQRSVFGLVAVLSVAMMSWAWLRGSDDEKNNPNILYPRSVDMGEVKLSNGALVASFSLTNLHCEDLLILGCQTSCSCVMLEKLQNIPALKPGTSVELRVKIVPTSLGSFKQAIDLHVNDMTNSRLTILFHGSVVN